MGDQPELTVSELRSMLVEHRRLPLGIAGLWNLRLPPEDPRLVELLFAMSRDERGRLEPEGRQGWNQSYDSFMLSRSGSSEDDHPVIIVVHKTHRLLTTLSYGRPHQCHAAWDSRWLSTPVELAFNWLLAEKLGWLYLPPTVYNTPLTDYEVPDDVQHEVDYVSVYGPRTLGNLAFNCAD